MKLCTSYFYYISTWNIPDIFQYLLFGKHPRFSFFREEKTELYELHDLSDQLDSIHCDWDE